jgi:hypothetical protein
MFTVHDPAGTIAIHAVAYLLLPAKQLLLFLLSNYQVLNFFPYKYNSLHSLRKKSGGVKFKLQGDHRIEPPLPVHLQGNVAGYQTGE